MRKRYQVVSTISLTTIPHSEACLSVNSTLWFCECTVGQEAVFPSAASLSYDLTMNRSLK